MIYLTVSSWPASESLWVVRMRAEQIVTFRVEKSMNSESTEAKVQVRFECLMWIKKNWKENFVDFCCWFLFCFVIFFGRPFFQLYEVILERYSRLSGKETVNSESANLFRSTKRKQNRRNAFRVIFALWIPQSGECWCEDNSSADSKSSRIALIYGGISCVKFYWTFIWLLVSTENVERDRCVCVAFIHPPRKKTVQKLNQTGDTKVNLFVEKSFKSDAVETFHLPTVIFNFFVCAEDLKLSMCNYVYFWWEHTSSFSFFFYHVGSQVWEVCIGSQQSVPNMPPPLSLHAHAHKPPTPHFDKFGCA